MARTKTEKLARQLFSVGRRKKHELDNIRPTTTESVFFKQYPNHLKAWLEVARHVEKNFVRRGNKLNAELAQAQTEIERLRAGIIEHNQQMSSARQLKRPNNVIEALRILADWFDAVYDDAKTGDDYVQQDLRNWADDIIALRSQLAKAREATAALICPQDSHTLGCQCTCVVCRRRANWLAANQEWTTKECE